MLIKRCPANTFLYRTLEFALRHSSTVPLSAEKKQRKISKVKSKIMKTSGPTTSRSTAKKVVIPMVPEYLHKSLFGSSGNCSEREMSTTSGKQGDLSIQIPPLLGDSLPEHFETISDLQTRPYITLIEQLSRLENLADVPKEWVTTPGWSKYWEDGSVSSVPYPPDDVLVFDVETCVKEEGIPVMANAVSKKYWYSWVSDCLFEDEPRVKTDLEGLIPFGHSDNPRLIVGHNVSFDRSRIREEYFVESGGLRFWDTMSMHIAICGLTSDQQATFANLQKKPDQEQGIKQKPQWMMEWKKNVSKNNLVDVHGLHCKNTNLTLSKDPRSVFTNGELTEIKPQFQELMSYCALDVRATWNICKAIWPEFKKRFPSNVTKSGMLEMGKAYLPITDNWEKYVARAEKECDCLEETTGQTLSTLAAQALLLMKDKRYEDDAWLWDENWSVLKKNPRNSFPKWYRELKKTGDGEEKNPTIRPSSQLAPKLLKLCWDGFPLFFSREFGWGFLRPKNPKIPSSTEGSESNDKHTVYSEKTKDFVQFPLRSIVEASKNGNMAKRSTWAEQTEIPMSPGCFFHKLPHPNGENLRVGSPLSKEFLRHIESGRLTSENPELVGLVAKSAKLSNYWHNNRDRIMGQNRQWLSPDYLPEEIKRAMKNDPNWDSRRKIGTILPQVIVSGTVTRRAVERTWMTASNPRADRVGSELKALSEAPPGYSFAGADVDSQEQWIAALLGDKYKGEGKAGSTKFSEMLLMGNKADGTDLHSMISKKLGISRDQAKILNYGRLYGAGLPFAKVLLKQFIPGADEAILDAKAARLYKLTKGTRTRQSGKSTYARFSADKNSERLWKGGYESDVFNCLEETVSGVNPVTPVLKCSISRSLSIYGQPNTFLPSKVNWVVQSSAVDFLHLLLCSMQWLCTEYNIDARYAISIHDEIRYIVRNEDVYRCALALQMSNLLTRAMFSYSVGIFQLPLSVAFFSQVDVDKVMRKEPNMECITPSNPHGMTIGYNIPPGQSLDINEILLKTGGSLVKKE